MKINNNKKLTTKTFHKEFFAALQVLRCECQEEKLMPIYSDEVCVSHLWRISFWLKSELGYLKKKKKKINTL